MQALESEEKQDARGNQTARGQGGSDGEARIDVKHEVAETLIAAMEQGNAPWQRPWSAQSTQSLRPINAISSNGYRGVNRILLSLSGRSSNLWMTYQQAASKGWQVRKGEKGTMIVKLVEFERGERGGEAEASGHGGRGEPGDKGERDGDRKSFALRRYFVFNAEQIDGMPEVEREPESVQEFEPAERAEAVVQALKEKTGLIVVHGGDKACYVPALDEVRLPPKKAFKTRYDLWATAMHECAHSTLHEKRLNRTNALGQRWGDAAYSLEELRAEIASAIMVAETGVAAQVSPEHARHHTEQHAAYLRSWIKSIERDPMAIFSAAKDAEAMAEYMLGLERQMTALEPHKEWIAEYERA
jgi:antirestriction protein ArdC